MKARVFPAALAALALAGCGTTAHAVTHPQAHAAPAAATASPLATANTAGDIQACKAFREATTTGVPATDGPQNTLQWLLNQSGSADNPLIGDIGAFIEAMAASPPDANAADHAAKLVKRDCQPYGGA